MEIHVDARFTARTETGSIFRMVHSKNGGKPDASVQLVRNDQRVGKIFTTKEGRLVIEGSFNVQHLPDKVIIETK